MNDTTLNIRISSELMDGLREDAKAEGVTTSALIKTVLTCYLKGKA